MSVSLVPFGVDIESLSEEVQHTILNGKAPIKPNFLLATPPRITEPVQSQETAPLEKENTAKRKASDDKAISAPQEDTKPNKKRPRGQNKNADRREAQNQVKQVCSALAGENRCHVGDKCKFEHDIAGYVKDKPAPPPALQQQPQKCRFFEKYSMCPYGVNCLASDEHVDEDFKNLCLRDGKKVVVDFRIHADDYHADETNRTTQTTKMSLRGKKYTFPHLGAGSIPKKEIMTNRYEGPSLRELWKDKLILAPLTTVGNLPFRRLCVSLGCDVTVSEMALAQSLLEGNRAEHALLQRHESEKCFGIQIAGGYPDLMTRCADFLVSEPELSFDFLDINAACPLDGLHAKGAGSALMTKNTRMEQMVKNLVPVLATKNIPLTCKLRMAHLDQKKLLAHKVVPKLCEWGVQGVFLHGRTAQQRYTKAADWDYIAQVQMAIPEEYQNKVPLYGCGDVMSYTDYENRRDNYGVAGSMLARGALIKPWIFTEIKDRRHWDISASERFDLLKRFVDFGLDHWGTDQRGVENCRRFLLEELSFQYRYIPVGLLEVVPQHINWRPQGYRGRSDLETLLGSPASEDWVRISELLLGKAPPGFTFVPKHKSNSYIAPAVLTRDVADGSVAKNLGI